MQFDCECGLATAYEDPPECPECGRRMKHLRLEVLEREHAVFFERWHDERRKREALERAIRQHQADVRYATQGAALSLADDTLYKALKVGADGTAPDGHNDRVEGRDAALSRRVPSHDGLAGKRTEEA